MKGTRDPGEREITDKVIGRVSVVRNYSEYVRVGHVHSDREPDPENPLRFYLKTPRGDNIKRREVTGQGTKGRQNRRGLKLETVNRPGYKRRT